jgi:hypothetical protein
MSFDSYHFIGFVLLVVVLYHAIRPTYYRYIWILLCSYFFYGFWEYRFLFLLFGMTVVSFYTALWLENNRGCKNSNKILAGFILLALMPLVFDDSWLLRLVRRRTRLGRARYYSSDRDLFFYVAGN